MKKALITGATGFIGSYLCRELLKQGVQVYGVGRNKNKLDELSKYSGFHPICLDFDNYYKLPEFVSADSIDYFFHTALFGVNGKDKKDYKIQLKNTEIACDVVILASKMNCKRFVMIGSVDEFESCFQPDSEFTYPNHSRIYGIAKFAAENIGKTIAFDIGLEYVSAILSLTYGSGNATNILPNMLIKNAAEGRAMNLIMGDNYFDMIYINDAVKGILAVAEHGRNMESYFIGHTELKTFRAYVEEMRDALETDIELIFGTYKDSKSVVDFEKIRRNKLYSDTGFVCETDIKQAVKLTKAWLLNKEE